MFEQIPPEVRDLAPGAIGSGVALRWLPGPWYWRLATFAGGVACAYFGTQPVAELFEMSTKWHGVIGLLLGLLSMSAVAKVIGTIEAINPGEIWIAFRDALRKRLGV